MWRNLYTILFLMLVIPVLTKAQLCTGSLGDPIINITFGQGSNPGPQLSAATTSYQYVTSDCPNDGYYSVRNSSSSCFGDTWHSLVKDHTGNTGGYFMLVNASFQPSAFYLDTVRGLCGGTTYEFAAWIMNVIVPSSCSGNTIQPNLTFNIERTDGTILQTYNTGNLIPEFASNWKQYGSFFTTPAGVTDVVLRMYNNSQGGCGNDLALDDITFRPCGPQLTPTIIGFAAPEVSICEGTSASYTFNCAISGGFSNPSFLWQQRVGAGSWTDIAAANSTTLTRSFPLSTAAGEYEFRMAVAEAGNMNSAQCRIVSAPLRITVNANPVVSLTHAVTLCEGNNLLLTASGGSDYSWVGPGGFSTTGPSVTINDIRLNQSGKYYVNVINPAGCITGDSSTVLVNPVPVAKVIPANASACSGDSVQLTASGGNSFLWIPASGLSHPDIYNPKASPGSTLEYKVIVGNQFGCTDTTLATVTVVKRPLANAGPDRVMIKGQPIQLASSISGDNFNFSWTGSGFIDDIHAMQPFVNPPAEATYILKAISNVGCGADSDTMYVKVYDDIFIPSAFSPNNDGINETWNIPALAAYSVFEESVYNRYGQLVFHTKNSMRGWDGYFKGDPLPVGAYIYFITVGANRRVLKGTVFLIR